MPPACRADHVGSLLRPNEIKEARTALRDGRLDAAELLAIENHAILDALERRRAAAVRAVRQDVRGRVGQRQGFHAGNAGGTDPTNHGSRRPCAP